MKHSKIPAFRFKQTCLYSLVMLCFLGLYSCDIQEEDLGGQGASGNQQNREAVLDEDIQNQADIAVPIDVEADVVEKEVVEQFITQRQNPENLHNRVELIEESIPERKVHQVSEATIEALNSVAEVYREEEFSEVAVSYFDDLSSELHGSNFYAEKAEEVVDNVLKIFSTRLSEGTDIVLLIDKTGSMEDDLEQVRKGLAEIEDFLSDFDDVNIAVASYGDRNWHGDLWYSSSDMSNDFSKISTFMDGYTMMSNPDSPESVNDAIVKVVDETFWTPGHKRLLLVIGDAPSHTGEFSNYSSSDVVARCEEQEVTFNLYPVIIANLSKFTPAGSVKVITPNVFPNPVHDIVTIDFEDSDAYDIGVFDLSGREVLSQQTLDVDRVQLSLGHLPPGQYIIHIYALDESKNGIARIVVQH